MTSGSWHQLAVKLLKWPDCLNVQMNTYSVPLLCAVPSFSNKGKEESNLSNFAPVEGRCRRNTFFCGSTTQAEIVLGANPVGKLTENN